MSVIATRPTVADVMHTPVVHVRADAPLREVVRALRDHGVSGVPVVDDAGLAVGIVTVSDLMWLAEELIGGDAPRRDSAADRPLPRTAGDVMTPDLFGVAPTASLEELVSFFSRTALHRALVLEDRRVVGIVSATDLLGLLDQERAQEPIRARGRERPPAGARPDAVVRKDLSSWRVQPNLVGYETARARFSWEEARREVLSGLPGGKGLNIAHEAVDRHARGERAGRTAVRWLGRSGARRELTYAELARASSRFAHGLRGLGVEPGESVFTLLGRVPELYVAALGTLKARGVLSPLFSTFGPEPVRARLDKGDARVLVTTPELYRRKVEPIRSALPGLRHVLLIGGDGGSLPIGCRSYGRMLEDGRDVFEIESTDPESPALLHFTSGTTGLPKGALHVHEAILAHHVTAALALDLHDGDVFWCTADPGWVTGTSYGILAPLSHGITSVVDEGDLDAERWYGILRDEQVSVWYTAPTAVRMLMKAGTGLARRTPLPDLRFIASVGEPLNPEAVTWGIEAFGLPIHDNWWQTETGGIMIANFAALDVHPGSMGLPLPGVDAGVVHREADGRVTEITAPGVQGELALRPGWPSMFRGYLQEEDRYRKCFAGGWYLTGDLVRRDAEGRYWFVGRADDVIKSAGHLIGPFEVENALLEHPAVAEAAVIGIPDPTIGEVVRAFVSLKRGREPSEELRLELIAHARRRLGPAVAPRSVDFRDDLPRTRSGKIMRRLLRARELGLPEGDLSTLEASGAVGRNVR